MIARKKLLFFSSGLMFIVGLAVTGSNFFTKPISVQAAAAQCAREESIMSCSRFPFAPGVTQQADKCYTLAGRNEPTPGFYFVEASCNSLPFTPNTQVVRCNDDQLVSGLPDQSPDQICRDHGGSNVDGGNIDENNPIISKVLKPLIQVLTAGVGIVIIISLIISGIQYSAARDNAQMVAAAKMRILMALLALVIFIFGFAVLQWLVPSGVL